MLSAKQGCYPLFSLGKTRTGDLYSIDKVIKPMIAQSFLTRHCLGRNIFSLGSMWKSETNDSFTVPRVE
ncbi:hypothetical protein SKAU_G00264120 [Synaphobranchus kaupii]|uniref:Uncharacterized protein n=1 Tax=Synaphobranchus kaupii TaxID=118154 RepID=A0A9Q1EZ18_SYNKA|nr:hypothetical protein SKAU_G00264120 [Synaphobranchus kaupii]